MPSLILPIPNNKAAQERYPPSCHVLWKNHNERSIPAKVKSLSIHLLSKATLVFLEGHTDPVSVDQLCYAPSCPVWIEGQIKGTVVCSYHDDRQLKYYKIETMEGCKDIAEQKVSFRQTTPDETSYMDKKSSVSTNACQSEVSQSNLTKSKPKPIVSPDRSTNINDDSSVRPLTNYLAIPQWISRSHLEGKSTANLSSTIILTVISRKRASDVIDNDTIKEISYSTRCSSVYIPTGTSLRICVTATSEDALNNAIKILKDRLLESVEDHEVERLRSDLVRPDACLNSNNDRPTPDLLQTHDPFENKGIKKKRTQQDCHRDDCQNGSPVQESYPETSQQNPAKKQAKLESPTSILSRKCPDDALTRFVHVPLWSGNWSEIKSEWFVIVPCVFSTRPPFLTAIYRELRACVSMASSQSFLQD